MYPTTVWDFTDPAAATVEAAAISTSADKRYFNLAEFLEFEASYDFTFLSRAGRIGNGDGAGNVTAAVAVAGDGYGEGKGDSADACTRSL